MLIKKEVFWDVTGYELVNSYQCFGGVCYPHLEGLAAQKRPGLLILNTVTTALSKMFRPIYQAIWHHIAEHNLNTHCH